MHIKVLVFEVPDTWREAESQQMHQAEHMVREASPENVRVTEEAVQAGKLLGIEVLDHILVGQEVWLSLREKRLGFK